MVNALKFPKGDFILVQFHLSYPLRHCCKYQIILNLEFACFEVEDVSATHDTNSALSPRHFQLMKPSSSVLQ